MRDNVDSFDFGYHSPCSAVNFATQISNLSGFEQIRFSVAQRIEHAHFNDDARLNRKLCESANQLCRTPLLGRWPRHLAFAKGRRPEADSQFSRKRPLGPNAHAL